LEKSSSNTPLQILFISSWYPNEEHPTLGNFVQKHTHSVALLNKVAVITVVSSEKRKTLHIEKRTERDVCEYLAYFPRRKGFFSRAINYLRNKRAFKEAFEMYRAEHGLPDLVHLHVSFPLGIWARGLKKKFGIPYLVTEHASGFHIGTDHSYPERVLLFCKKILKGSEIILPVSEDLKHSLQLLVPHQSFEVISNVVDEHLFRVQEKEGIVQVRFIHISTGIDSIKNLSGMLRAVDVLSGKRQDFTFDIVSDGDVEYAKVLASQMQHGSLVRFHATKSTEEIAEMLCQSSCLLLFSNYENFPCVIPEAFMSGVPVISTAVNGIPEHVHSDKGILVEKGNEAQLVQAMETFLERKFVSDPEKIRAYALNHFSYSAVGRKLDRIYRKILG
jgi:glycosyltransferase involved in cell wall biosynthesis